MIPFIRPHLARRAVIALLAASAFVFSGAAPSSAQTKPKIVAASLTLPVIAPLVWNIMKVRGFDAKHGFELELKPYPSIAAYYAGFATGEVDVQVGGPTVYQKLRIEGVPARIIEEASVAQRQKEHRRHGQDADDVPDREGECRRQQFCDRDTPQDDGKAGLGTGEQEGGNQGEGDEPHQEPHRVLAQVLEPFADQASRCGIGERIKQTRRQLDAEERRRPCRPIGDDVTGHCKRDDGSAQEDAGRHGKAGFGAPWRRGKPCQRIEVRHAVQNDEENAVQDRQRGFMRCRRAQDGPAVGSECGAEFGKLRGNPLPHAHKR